MTFFLKLHKSYKSTFITLYRSFAYSYFIYCNIYSIEKQLPLSCPTPERIFLTKETCLNYNWRSISIPNWAVMMQTKLWMLVISVTTALGLSCMDVYMTTFLVCLETIYKEILIYMTIIFDMQMLSSPYSTRQCIETNYSPRTHNNILCRLAGHRWQ